MPTSQGRNKDGQLTDIGIGQHHRSQLVAQAHGKYAEQAFANRLFYTSTVVAGLAVPLNTTTAPTVMLWNPSDSGVDAVLGRFIASEASGTSAGGGWGLMAVSTTVSVGSNIATGNLITAFAQDVLGTNVFSARLLGASRPKVKSSSQGTNTITAGAWIRTMGVAVHAAVTTSSAVDLEYLVHDFEGEVILTPGTAVYVASNVASIALFQQTLSWYEVPVS